MVQSLKPSACSPRARQAARPGGLPSNHRMGRKWLSAEIPLKKWNDPFSPVPFFPEIQIHITNLKSPYSVARAARIAKTIFATFHSVIALASSCETLLTMASILSSILVRLISIASLRGPPISSWSEKASRGVSLVVAPENFSRGVGPKSGFVDPRVKWASSFVAFAK